MQEGSRRAVLTAFFANLGIAVAKFVAYLFTGAASMLAEAVHSVADTGNQGLLLLGGHRARRPPTPEHPFGYGRERYFWAFVVAMVLFSLGSTFAIVEGIDKLRHPHQVSDPVWAVGVLAVAIAFEIYALRTAVRAARPLRRGRSWYEFIRRAKSPELPVVLLEDTGALLGLGFALVGVGLTVATGEPRFDALGSLAIGLLLGAIAILLAVEMKSLLIGEAAAPRRRAAIVRAIESEPTVRKLVHLRTQHLGPEELLVCARVELDAALDFAAVAKAIDAIEARVAAALPGQVLVYVAPETAAADRSARAGSPAGGLA